VAGLGSFFFAAIFSAFFAQKFSCLNFEGLIPPKHQHENIDAQENHVAASS